MTDKKKWRFRQEMLNKLKKMMVSCSEKKIKILTGFGMKKMTKLIVSYFEKDQNINKGYN